MNRKSAFRAALVAGIALTAISTAARAEEAADGAPNDATIVVTGQRQQYRGDIPVKELPQSVQIIDSRVLQQLNVTRLDAALDLASGVSKQNNFGGLWDAFAVRGFAGDENFPSGFLVNGFNGGRGYGGPRDASNIDHIEVLKGPNAAVFGRGEPGGTVNIITKKATTRDTFGSFSVSGGSFNTYRVEGDYNLKISDSIALRVNGAAEQADSFRDFLHSQKKVLSPSVLFKLGAGTSLTYEMEYVNQDVPFDRGTIALNGVLGVVPRSRFFGEPGDGQTAVKVFGHQLQLEQDLGNDWVLLVGGGYRSTIFRGYSSDAEIDLLRQTVDNDLTNLARQRRYRDYATTNGTVRSELSGKIQTGPLTHHVILGGDWDEFTIDLHQFRFRGPRPGVAGTASNTINIYNPVYGQMPTPGSQITNSLEKQKAWGVYFSDQIDVTDALKLRFGGRFDHFNQNILDRNSATGARVVNTYEKFSPTAGLLYKITDSFSIYAGYGRGFRPNSGTGAPPVGQTIGTPFAPEKSQSYEVGLRYASPGNAIVGSIAAYTMKKTNILTTDPSNGNFSIAAGSARSKGIEADLTANLPGDVHIIATYAYTDAAWDTASKDVNFAQPINPGDPLINIPKHAANLLVTKGFDLGSAGKLTAGAGVNHVSSRLGETATRFYLPSYTLTRALLSYEPTDNIRVGVDVTNLFDVTWYASSYSQFWVQPGTPRTITGRVSFSF